MIYKRHRYSVLSALLLTALLLSCIPAFAAGKSWVIAARKAGIVESKLAQSQSWLRIPNSRRLGLDDSIRTNEKGKATLTLADSSLIAINPNTTVVMRKFVLNSRQRHVETDIECGHLRTQVSKFRGQDNRYQITSPNAVMAAQGTDFSARVIGVEKNVKTIICVYSGSVSVKNRRTDEVLIVTAGHGAIIYNEEPLALFDFNINGTKITNISASAMQNGNVDLSEFEEEIELPQGGDARLQAIPPETRGEIGGRQEPLGIDSMGTSGERSNPAAPIIPTNPASNTGSVVIDLTPFNH
ncbi:MAG: FecR family protein [bacterium]|nr:FecR family protein [bacterium]